ncbi:hypothetical protein HDU93_004539, partial [Gonapodya sp. JEL0774]
MARVRPFGPLDPEEKALKIAEARTYQRELFEKAKADNIIAVLDTGTGKTFIAAMLIKYVHEREDIERMKDPSYPKKKTFFLVNLVPLVFQQAAFLEHNLHLSVGRYCSEMETAGEKRELWSNRIANHDVHVMTAQIFLNILVSGWILMDQVNLLIFDEAHHAIAAHPYSLIMRNFYMASPPDSRPKVFGMTASPAKRFSRGGEGIEVSLQDLALCLDSKIITSVDLTAISAHAPRPDEKILRYHLTSQTSSFPCTPLALAFWSELSRYIMATQDPRDRRFFAAMLSDAIYLLQDMGPWASDLALLSVLAEVIVRYNRYFGRARGRVRGVSPVVAEAIKGLSRLFSGVVKGKGVQWFELPWGKDRIDRKDRANRNGKNLPQGTDQVPAAVNGNGVAPDESSENQASASTHASPADPIDDDLDAPGEVEADGLPEAESEPAISPEIADASRGQCSRKVQALLDLLRTYRERRNEFRGIIFVEKRTAATALAEILNKSMGEDVEMAHLGDGSTGKGWLKAGSLVGHGAGNRDAGAIAARRVEMDFREQNRVIRQFKKGEINLLVATSVAEEGLDVQPCMLVVRYDLPRTHIAYIQSRGRARKKNSAFYFMVEAYNMEHTKLIVDLTSRERQLRECLAVSSSEDAQIDGLFPAWAKRLEARPQMEHDPELTVLSKVPGAVITIDQAVAALTRFCSKLPSDRFYFPRPDFTVEQTKNGDWTASLTLPSVLPAHLRYFVAPKPAASKREGRQLVALEALKKLYEFEWLDNHFRAHVPGSEMFQSELRKWGRDGFEELLQQGLVEGQPHMNGVMIVSRVHVPKCWLPTGGLELDDDGNRITLKRKADDDLASLTLMQPRVLFKKPKILEKRQRIRLDGLDPPSSETLDDDHGNLKVGEIAEIEDEATATVEAAPMGEDATASGLHTLDDTPLVDAIEEKLLQEGYATIAIDLPAVDEEGHKPSSDAISDSMKVAVQVNRSDSMMKIDEGLAVEEQKEDPEEGPIINEGPKYLGSGYAEPRRVLNPSFRRRMAKPLLPPEVMEEHETWYLNIVEKNGVLLSTGFLTAGPLPITLTFRLYAPPESKSEIDGPRFDSFSVRTVSVVPKATDLTTIQSRKLQSGEVVQPYVLVRNTMAQVRRYNHIMFGTMLKKSVEEQDLDNPYLWLLVPVKEKPAEKTAPGSFSFTDFSFTFGGSLDAPNPMLSSNNDAAAAQLDRGMLHTFRRGYFNKRCPLKDKTRYPEVVGRLVVDLAGYKRTYHVEEILSISPFDPLPNGLMLQHGKARLATVAEYYEKAWKVERDSIEHDQGVIRVSLLPKKIDYMRPLVPDTEDERDETVANVEPQAASEANTPLPNHENITEPSKQAEIGSSSAKKALNLVPEDTAYLLPQFSITSPMGLPCYIQGQQFPSLLTLTHRFLGVLDFLEALGFGNDFSEADLYRFMLALSPSMSPIPPYDPNHHESEIHYERLETLGDGFLKVCLSTFLVVTHPTWFEGALSKVRAQMQSNETLWKQGLRLKVRWERFLAAGAVSMSRKNWEPLRHFVSREVPKKTVADTVEATIAAFLLARGENSARQFVELLYREGMTDGCFVNLDIVNDQNAATQHTRIVDLECREVMVGVTSHPKMALVPLVEEMLGYTFKRKELALMAVTHGSAVDTPVSTYERVEFLGDSVLDFTIIRHLYLNYSTLPPSILTILRSLAVNNKFLAFACVKLGLHKLIDHGERMLMGLISEFVDDCQEQESLMIEEEKKPLDHVIRRKLKRKRANGRSNVVSNSEQAAPL